MSHLPRYKGWVWQYIYIYIYGQDFIVLVQLVKEFYNDKHFSKIMRWKGSLWPREKMVEESNRENLIQL